MGSTTHGVGGNFSIDTSDCYIGQNPTASGYSDRRKTQFMGELHEISILGISKNPIQKYKYPLYPLFKEILLYMDFEEANLNG